MGRVWPRHGHRGRPLNSVVRQHVRGQRVLFIAGIPGTGKSYFASWMQMTHRYVHAELENEQARRALGISDAWTHLTSAGDITPLFDILRRIEPGATIEWGFPPHCLPVVKALIALGAEPWWFDGDVAAARAQFIHRNTVPVANFDAQLPKIHAAWPQIAEVFDENIIRVLDAEGAQMPCGEIWRRINEHAA